MTLELMRADTVMMLGVVTGVLLIIGFWLTCRVGIKTYVIATVITIIGLGLIIFLGNTEELTIEVFYQSLGFEIFGAGLTFIYLELLLPASSASDDTVQQLKQQVDELRELVTQLKQTMPQTPHNHEETA